MKRHIYLLLIIVLGFSSSFNPAYCREGKGPKNIIILIGDGMGLNDVTAEVLLNKGNAFRRFRSTGFSVTCSADKLITDSAAGATALSTGYRTNNGYLAVDTLGNRLKTILELAHDKGLSTGLVVTSTITNATPAGFSAHVKNRAEENEIARQLSEGNVDVAIGGGLRFFAADEDKKNPDLVKRMQERGYKFFKSIDELTSYNDYGPYFALLEDDNLKPAESRDYSLADLTSCAIKNLNHNEKGFVLMVEGSQIDKGGHAKSQDKVLGEMKDFDKAVNLALDFAQKDGSTLVLVTSDHETGGISLTGGERNYSNLKLTFVSGDHTANMVGVFSFGPGEENFRGINENYEVGRKLINCLNPGYLWH
ncbi:MAG: alkaline phosphatase [Bacteroidota bacterium]|jgi:alkaline phosphatase|nr:alkaline phosphatase [Ignavibacteria bacterium]MCU7521079.1 alkaline phosphatase [Ignavibacteria bacterium]MCU7524300.1 alkaline phosphatase [Ignavibacteria bacterium]